MPGGFHTISVNGNVAGTGVLWASHPYTGDANQNIVPGMLRAFDPYDLAKRLCDSQQDPLRDDFETYAQFNPQCRSAPVSIRRQWVVYSRGRYSTGSPPTCCAQQTGMHILVVEALLIL